MTALIKNFFENPRLLPESPEQHSTQKSLNKILRNNSFNYPLKLNYPYLEIPLQMAFNFKIFDLKVLVKMCCKNATILSCRSLLKFTSKSLKKSKIIVMTILFKIFLLNLRLSAQKPWKCLSLKIQDHCPDNPSTKFLSKSTIFVLRVLVENSWRST